MRPSQQQHKLLLREVVLVDRKTKRFNDTTLTALANPQHLQQHHHESILREV